MKVAILTANLNSFDDPYDPVDQIVPEGVEVIFHRWTDENFPPITGLTPRLQYRIPKLFGWEMLPGADVYIWLDGSLTFERSDSVSWYLEQLGDADAAFFRHPARRNIRQESDHIEEKLQQNNWYIVPRYKGGLHKEQVAECLKDSGFKDNSLYASTAFIYRDNEKVRVMMKEWWYQQSRYFTCDQIALPYAIFKSGVKVNMIKDNLYKIGYNSLVSKHR